MWRRIGFLASAIIAFHLFAFSSKPNAQTGCTSPPGQVPIYNTGVDSCGNLLPDKSADPHYSVGGGPAYVVINGVFPLDGNWLPDGPSSKWIAPSATGAGGQGTTFDYRTTFVHEALHPQAKVLKKNTVM